MKKNKFTVGQTIKLNLRKNLKPVYSRLLNKNIDLAGLSKVNSETKFGFARAVNQQKSLKLRAYTGNGATIQPSLCVSDGIVSCEHIARPDLPCESPF